MATYPRLVGKGTRWSGTSHGCHGGAGRPTRRAPRGRTPASTRSTTGGHPCRRSPPHHRTCVAIVLGVGGLGADVSRLGHDTILKAMGEVFVGLPLSILDLDLPPVVGLVSADLPQLTVRGHTADTVWIIVGGDRAHPEYQSTPVTHDDLMRFAQYDLLLCRRDGCRVHTIVVYTTLVPDAPTTLDLGSIVYHVHAVHLARMDGDAVLDTLRAKVQTGSAIDREEEIRLALSCLMRHQARTAEQAAHEAIDLAQSITHPRRRETCVAAIGGFGAKILGDEALKDLLRRVADMTKAAEVLREIGREEGWADGALHQARESLVEDFAVLFGSVPPAVEQQVRQTEDIERLKGWRRTILKAGSAAAAAQAILGDH